jgi:hypothetical protein
MRTGYGPKKRTMRGKPENKRMHLMTFIEISKPCTTAKPTNTTVVFGESTSHLRIASNSMISGISSPTQPLATA